MTSADKHYVVMTGAKSFYIYRVSEDGTEAIHYTDGDEWLRLFGKYPDLLLSKHIHNAVLKDATFSELAAFVANMHLQANHPEKAQYWLDRI